MEFFLGHEHHVISLANFKFAFNTRLVATLFDLFYLPKRWQQQQYAVFHFENHCVFIGIVNAPKPI